MTKKIPKTTAEALEMIKKGWFFMLKKYPIFFYPLTLWMIFGGGIFLYQYITTDTFTIKELKKPLTSQASFNIIDYAYATEKDDIPIIFNGEFWGAYEDTTLEVKAVKDKPILLVYDKILKKVYQVDFKSERNVGKLIQQKGK